MDFLSSKIQVLASGFSNRPSSPEVEKKKKKKCTDLLYEPVSALKKCHLRLSLRGPKGL